MNDINKFIFLLRKGVYPYEYIDEWEKFNETSLPEKEEFYSNLNMNDITNPDYIHATRVCKNFEIKILGEYHDLYRKSYALLSTDVFEDFRKMCSENYHLDSSKVLSAPGLTYQAPLEKTEVKLDLLTDIDMLLVVEKGTRGEICHAIHQHAKDNNKFAKVYDNNEDWSYLKHWDINTLCKWVKSCL